MPNASSGRDWSPESVVQIVTTGEKQSGRNFRPARPMNKRLIPAAAHPPYGLAGVEGLGVGGVGVTFFFATVLCVAA